MIDSERETSVAYTDADKVVRIYTCVRRDITSMKKKHQFTLVDEGTYDDGSVWATFSIPTAKFDIGQAAKTTRTLSDEQRAALSARLKESRANKKENEA